MTSRNGYRIKLCEDAIRHVLESLEFELVEVDFGGVETGGPEVLVGQLRGGGTRRRRQWRLHADDRRSSPGASGRRTIVRWAAGQHAADVARFDCLVA